MAYSSAKRRVTGEIQGITAFPPRTLSHADRLTIHWLGSSLTLDPSPSVTVTPLGSVMRRHFSCSSKLTGTYPEWHGGRTRASDRGAPIAGQVQPRPSDKELLGDIVTVGLTGTLTWGTRMVKTLKRRKL